MVRRPGLKRYTGFTCLSQTCLNHLQEIGPQREDQPFSLRLCGFRKEVEKTLELTGKWIGCFHVVKKFRVPNKWMLPWQLWGKGIRKKCIIVFPFSFLKILLILSDLYTRVGTWIHNPEFKSPMLFLVVQSGAPCFSFPNFSVMFNFSLVVKLLK